MAGVAYSDDRVDQIGYPDSEMLNETFYIYKDTDDSSMQCGDIASYSGKKIGTLKDNQRDIILSLSDKEDCVIVGRCANHILQDRTLSVFIYAPFETRVKNVMERLDREEKAARKLVKRMDKERRSYYEFFTDEKWLDMGQYDLCIDSSRFTTEEIVKILKEAYER